MHTSIETYPVGTTTVKKMGIMLILAFVGGQLSALGSLTTFMAGLVFAPNPTQAPFGTPIISEGIGMAILAVLLHSASFLALSLYPEHGKRQIAAALLAPVILILGIFPISWLLEFAHISEKPTLELEICFCIAIVFCLLVSGKIKGWRDLAGLGLGSVIGIGLRLASLYGYQNFDFSSIWLSSVFFSELLSGRASWRAAGVGLLIWAVLSGFATHVLHIF